MNKFDICYITTPNHKVYRLVKNTYFLGLPHNEQVCNFYLKGGCIATKNLKFIKRFTFKWIKLLAIMIAQGFRNKKNSKKTYRNSKYKTDFKFELIATL